MRVSSFFRSGSRVRSVILGCVLLAFTATLAVIAHGYLFSTKFSDSQSSLSIPKVHR